MRRFEFVKRGVKKFHDWGYVIVYMGKAEDCFSSEEIDQAILKLSSLPTDALSVKESDLLSKLKTKRVTICEKAL